MSRMRWQQGSLRIENKHNPVWVLRYLEDYREPNGQVRRVQRSVRLGTKQDFPTERAARREARKYLDPINASTYKPKSKITFKEFAEKWERDVLPAFKPAGRASTKSNLKRLNEWLGPRELSGLTTETLQQLITSLHGLASKTVANYITTLQRLWKSASAWGYVSHDPFKNLVLPKPELKEQPSFTPDQIKEIIRRAPEPYKTMFWIVAETGIRGGELCGLFKEDINLDARMIYVKRSAFQGQLQTPKTGNSVRAFPISAALCDHIRTAMRCLQGGPTNITEPSNLLNLAGNQDDERLVGARSGNDIPANPFSVQDWAVRSGQPRKSGGNCTDSLGVRPESQQVSRELSASDDDRIRRAAAGSSPVTAQGRTLMPATNLLFRTPRGCPYDNGNIVKRGLKPILRAMGIDGERVGLHAFRHANCSVMDSLNVPMQVRQERIGHASGRMTMRYTHSNSKDHRIVADALGELFSPEQPVSTHAENARNSENTETVLQMAGD